MPPEPVSTRQDFPAGIFEAASHNPICPKKGALFDPATGEVLRSNSCGRLYCPACYWRAILRRAQATRRSQPERFARYSTYDVTSPLAMRGMINRLHRLLRERGIAFEAAWHVEPNREQEGAHVHLFQHGSFVRREVLLELAQKAGFDDVWIEQWQDRFLDAYSYGMKLALSESTRDDLAYWNCGRLGSNTRNFWRDGADGGRLTLRQASARRGSGQ